MIAMEIGQCGIFENDLPRCRVGHAGDIPELVFVIRIGGIKRCICLIAARDSNKENDSNGQGFLSWPHLLDMTPTPFPQPVEIIWEAKEKKNVKDHDPKVRRLSDEVGNK